MVLRSLFFSCVLMGSLSAMEDEKRFSPTPVERRSEKAKAMRLRALNKGDMTLSTLKLVREKNRLDHNGVTVEERDRDMKEMEEAMEALRLKQQSEKQ